jgi:ribosomal-protein-alanine N-acetyltransferase
MNAFVDLSGVRLETDRLVLRPFVLDDLDDFYAYAKVPDVGEWAGWRHHENKEISRRILDSFIAGKKTFALVDKATGRVIGSLGIEVTHFPLPASYDKLQGRELGYVLAQDKWGQGLMSEAVKTVIDYCFNTLNFDFLTCGHFERNARSKRVIEKAGFRYLGTSLYMTQYGTIENNPYYVLDNPRRTK